MVVMTKIMAFKMNQGEYELRVTLWGWKDSQAYSEAQEVYRLDNGAVASCKVNACTSCAVCADKRTIAVDCSDVKRPKVWYKYGCDINLHGIVRQHLRLWGDHGGGADGETTSAGAHAGLFG